MDSLFVNNEFYSDEEFTKQLTNLRNYTIENFQFQTKNNGFKFFSLNSNYLDNLSELITRQNQIYVRKNKEIYIKTLNEKSGIIKQLYTKAMNRVMKSILSEKELKNKHFAEMKNLLEYFKLGMELQDQALLEPYQKDLQSFMMTEFTAIQKKLNEKLEEIVKKSTVMVANYIQEMDTYAKSDKIITDEEFKEFHETYSNDAFNSFANYLKDNPFTKECAFEHLDQFKKMIEKNFNEINNKFKRQRDGKLKGLELALIRSGQMHEDSINVHVNRAKSKEELKNRHQTIKDRLIQEFHKEYNFKEVDKIKPFIDILEEKFRKSLDKCYELFEIRMQIQEKLVKSLKQDIRRYYREEMQRFFQNKLYVPKSAVNKCHNIILRKTTEIYSSGKEDLSDMEFKLLAIDSVEDIFKKISEENDMKRPSESPAIGIDLGTTYSCVAYFNTKLMSPNNVVVCLNEMCKLKTPSVVSYRNNSFISVGDEAKKMSYCYPKNTISSVIRLIGRKFDDKSILKDMFLWSYEWDYDGDNNLMVSLEIDGQDMVLYPEQILAQILRKMKDIAEKYSGYVVTKAVITVPAYFDDGQKKATKDAGRLAGLEVLKIINEHTAAAIAFKVDRNEETESRNVLIFNFGREAFDVSILEIKRGIIDIKAVEGDNHLRGDDINICLMKYCLEEFEKEFKIRVKGEVAMCRLRYACKEHKKRLTAVESTVIEIDNFYKNNDLRVPLTRYKFEEINYHLFEKSIDLVRKLLENKNMKTLDIDDVVLVGGTTRIPKVQQMLSELFDDKPLRNYVDPDEAVVRGAAMHAAYLNAQRIESNISKKFELEYKTPLSLGIGTKGNRISVIVPRNTSIPTTITKHFSTSEDYQTVFVIKIFEGENKLTENNHLLGQFDLTGIPPKPKGKQLIGVTFSLNEEGLLYVKARILSTGHEKDIEIIEHKGKLTLEKIEQLISEQITL